MTTAYLTHPACLKHDMGNEHPECPQRIHAIEDFLIQSHLMDLLRYQEAPAVTREQLLRVHEAAYIDKILSFTGESQYLDGDTKITAQTPKAAEHAAGAVVKATDMVCQKQVKNAFCNVRPPGHHASQAQAMGFCFFNNAAVGAAHAVAEYGLERIAVCDFDVHHGNGTDDIFIYDDRVMVCSSFQHPFYPHTPLNEGPHIINTPLPAGTRSEAFRTAISNTWLPALEHFKPQMIFISAGFDAHIEDDMSHVLLQDNDYQWITQQLMHVAAEHADNRIVSTLEGGYALHALARSAKLHIKTLMGVA